MDQAKTETPTGDSAEKWLNQPKASRYKGQKDPQDLETIKQKGRAAKQKLEQHKEGAVTEAEAILHAPTATEIKEDKDAALIEAERVLFVDNQENPQAVTVPVLKNPRKDIRQLLKATYSSDISVAMFNLKKIQTLLASGIELPNREALEEEARIRAKDLYLKKLAEKAEE